MKVKIKDESAVRPLIVEINNYIKEISEDPLPNISFAGYKDFRDKGKRERSEKEYFQIRKRLMAYGLYFIWTIPSEKEIEVFNELLWRISNEFSWCLCAHIPYENEGFGSDSDKIIDLFSGETAFSLAEIINIHSDIIDPYIKDIIIKRINERIFEPYINNSWGWENSKSNWSGVCASTVAMTALLLPDEGLRDKILEKSDKNIESYIKGFGYEGLCEEGVAYWVYGFGFVLYYIEMRKREEKGFELYERIRDKIVKIAQYPYYMEIDKNSFVTFSDTTQNAIVPTGILSYIKNEFGVDLPYCDRVTSMDFDHCFRYGHISRNLMWTESNIFFQKESNFTKYFPEKQWLLLKQNRLFFAVKGGNNMEEHNHNDVGSFIIALDGKNILADLGAGSYTREYFGASRYDFVNTRSYWHNLPTINGREQVSTEKKCKVISSEIGNEHCCLEMELNELYDIKELKSFIRKININLLENEIVIEDSFCSSEKITVNEGLVSFIRPEIKENVVFWNINNSILEMSCSEKYTYNFEEKLIEDHYKEQLKIFRIGIENKDPEDTVNIKIKLKGSL